MKKLISGAEKKLINKKIVASGSITGKNINNLDKNDVPPFTTKNKAANNFYLYSNNTSTKGQ